MMWDSLNIILTREAEYAIINHIVSKMGKHVNGYRVHRNLVNMWFSSDLDIQFCLKQGKALALCEFESDVWYDHTRGSQRHNGNHRRFIVVDTQHDEDDSLYNQLVSWCYKLYSLEETLDVLGDFEYNEFQIFNSDIWEE